MTRFHIACSLTTSTAELWVFDVESGVVDFQYVSRVTFVEMNHWLRTHIDKWPNVTVYFDDCDLSRLMAEAMPFGHVIKFQRPIRYRELPTMVPTPISESEGKRR